MATVTVTQASNNVTLTPSFSFGKTGVHLRDASFSSYLLEDTFMLKLGDSTRSSPSAASLTADPLYQVSVGSRRYNQDGEISIFNAEKYFKGGMDDEQASKKYGKIELSGDDTKLKPGTPSTCSEVSWNSQNALLPGQRKEVNKSLQKQASSMRIFVGFGCNCSGKKSVDIDDKFGDKNSKNCRKIVDLGAPHCTDLMVNGPLTIGRISAAPSKISEEMNYKSFGCKREDCFTFPVSNPVAGNSTVRRKLQIDDENPRISLEVFGSPLIVKDLDPSQHRRLMMLTSDSGKRIEDIPALPGGKITIDEDDLESDSSSDLFEIGSLSGPSVLSRQASTSCYAPSEASIEWSVVTASGTGFSVAGSDYGDQKKLCSFISSTKTKSTKGKISMVKEAQRRQPSSFLSCRSNKALNVATDAYKVPQKSKQSPRRCLQSDSVMPMTIYTSNSPSLGIDSSHSSTPSFSKAISMHTAPSIHLM